jgi:ferredoxin
MSSPVYTTENGCQDCYKCVRHCPVKAIRIIGGKASVIPEACVACGECVKVCPAHAKKIRTDNVQERANREIKRRTGVVQCFPSKESLLRLVGAVLCEENVYWRKTRMFSEDSIASVDSFVAPAPTELELARAQTRAREIIQKAVETARTKE